MRLNRLQNVADTLCQMFQGWRLIQSLPAIARLGSGTLRINVLTGENVFEGNPIPALPITAELHAWMTQDLAIKGIPPAKLTHADLSAKLSLSTIPWSERTKKTQIFRRENQAITGTEMYRCLIECASEVATSTRPCRSSRKDVWEWPVGWPS